MSEELIKGYREHLVLERNLSENSIRAYLADLDSLLLHINALGITEFKDLTLDHLRSWLANQQSRGAARSTIIRRVASIKAFTYWATDNGWLDTDIGLQLMAPKPQRSLPKTIKVDDMKVAFSSMESVISDTEDPLSLRDLAMVELLYSSGIRVSELTNLDLNQIDFERNTVRVIGKGNRERIAPFGIPARKAIENWIEKRQEFAPERSKRSSSAAGENGSIRGRFGTWSIRSQRRSIPREDSGRTHCATAQRPTCSKVERTFAPSRSYLAIHPWPPHRSTPMLRVKDFDNSMPNTTPEPEPGLPKHEQRKTCL